MPCADGSTLRMQQLPGSFKCDAGAYAVGDVLINTLGVLVHSGFFLLHHVVGNVGWKGLRGVGGCNNVLGCTYIHTYIHTNIHTYIHAYIHTYIHTHTHTHIYIYIYVCVCLHIHLYIYIFCFHFYI